MKYIDESDKYKDFYPGYLITAVTNNDVAITLLCKENDTIIGYVNFKDDSDFHDIGESYHYELNRYLKENEHGELTYLQITKKLLKTLHISIDRDVFDQFVSQWGKQDLIDEMNKLKAHDKADKVILHISDN